MTTELIIEVDTLDQERAASMADEGGMSGAMIEREDDSILINLLDIQPILRSRYRARRAPFASPMAWKLLGGMSLLILLMTIRSRMKALRA